jgi:hypothetical protein
MNPAWRGLPLAIGLILTALVTRAEDANGDPGPSPTDMRREIFSEFKSAYKPEVKAVPSVADTPLSTQPGRGVVRMAPYVVAGSVDYADLHRALVQQHANAKEKAVYDKLGIAVHPIRVRKVTAAVLTIFYIPVAVSVGW